MLTTVNKSIVTIGLGAVLATIFVVLALIPQTEGVQPGLWVFAAFGFLLMVGGILVLLRQCCQPHQAQLSFIDLSDEEITFEREDKDENDEQMPITL